MNLTEAKKIVGSLGAPSKLPGASYGLPARACKTGSKLALVPGTVCSACYALGGRAKYQMPRAALGLERRLASLDHPLWIEAIVTLIDEKVRKACHEYTGLIRKHVKLVEHIRRSHSICTSSRNQTADAGCGSGQSTPMAMDIIQRPEVLSLEMYPLTLPHSGAIVALSQKDTSLTTSVDLSYALILTISKFLREEITAGSTSRNGGIALPEGLDLRYYFRFHDSGDLQSERHLSNICEVARRTPMVRYWLPTQELGMIKKFIAQGHIIPENLVVRVSAPMVNGSLRAWPQGSSVYTSEPPVGAWLCPASKQDNECKTCRACWSEIKHVAYPMH